MPSYPAIGSVKGGLLGIQPLIGDNEIRRQLVNIYRDNDFSRWLDLMGGWIETKTPRFTNYTEDPLTGVLDTTGMTVATSGTTTVTLTVVPTGTMMVGQLYKCVSGAQANIGVGRVQSVATSTTDTVVLKSVNATVLTITAGDKLVPAGNAQEEASNGVSAVRWSLTPTTNVTQIFKKKVSASDIAKATNYVINFTNEDGSEGSGLVNYEQVRGYMLHLTEIAQSAWAAEPGASYFDDIAGATLTGTNGNAVQVQRGIESYIRTYGTSATLSTPGTFTQTEIEAFNNLIDGVNGPERYMLVGGNPAVTRFMSYLKNLGSSGVTSVKLEAPADKPSDINMMVNRVEIGGREFNIMRWNNFDNTQYFSTGASVLKKLYAIPMGSTATKGGDVLPYLSMRYQAMSGVGKGDSKIGEYHTGMLAPTGPTNEVSEEACTYQSICGVEVLAAQKFASWTVL